MFESPSKNQPKTYNSENNQKYTDSKSDIYNTWRDKWEKILDTIIHESLLLLFDIQINIVVNPFNTKVLFSTVIWYKCDELHC